MHAHQNTKGYQSAAWEIPLRAQSGPESKALVSGPEAGSQTPLTVREQVRVARVCGLLWWIWAQHPSFTMVAKLSGIALMQRSSRRIHAIKQFPAGVTKSQDIFRQKIENQVQPWNLNWIYGLYLTMRTDLKHDELKFVMMFMILCFDCKALFY